MESVITAVDQLVADTGLIADGSRDHSLPTIPGKHGDLKTISVHTVRLVYTSTKAHILLEPPVIFPTLMIAIFLLMFFTC